MQKKQSNYSKRFNSFYVGVLIAATLTSCSSLTQTQINMAYNLAVSSDTIINSPLFIFQEIEKVRTGRGLFYAASLTTAQAHYMEVSALSDNIIRSMNHADNAMAYIKALNSYTRALRSISNKARWKSIGTEIRGVGSKTDTLFMAINSIPYLDRPLPEGASKLAGRSVAFISENYMKARQAKAVRSFVMESDSLVAVCVENLIEVLQSPLLNALFEHENISLKNDYQAYLNAVEIEGQLVPISYDERYIELQKSLNSAKYARTRCLISLRAFARAHHKLYLCFESSNKKIKREHMADLYSTIIQMNAFTDKIIEYIETL